MFGVINFQSFILTTIVICLIPGSDTMFVLGNSISSGKKAGIFSAIGAATGCMIHTTLAALGLSLILAKSLLLFNIIKYLGAGFLIFLGIRSLSSKISFPLTMVPVKLKQYRKIYIQGIMTDVLNPKVALFFLAFLPQFISPDNTYGILPFFLLGLTFASIGVLWLCCLTTCSSYISDKLSQKAEFTNLLEKLKGIIFIGLGLNLLRARLDN